MTNFYNAEYLKKLKSKKTVVLSVVLLIMLVMLLVNVILIINYSTLPYGVGLRPTYIAISCTVTVILVFISAFLFQIMYSPIKNYYNKIVDLLRGNKQSDLVTVLNVDEFKSNKLGIEYKSLTVLVWSDAQNDYIERTILYDANFDIDVKVNQMANVITCGNVILAYEVK